MPQPIADNTLFYGDNLDILREYTAGESYQPSEAGMEAFGGGVWTMSSTLATRS